MLVHQALQDVGQPRVVLRRADQRQRAQRVKRVQVGVCWPISYELRSEFRAKLPTLSKSPLSTPLHSTIYMH